MKISYGYLEILKSLQTQRFKNSLRTVKRVISCNMYTSWIIIIYYQSKSY